MKTKHVLSAGITLALLFVGVVFCAAIPALAQTPNVDPSSIIPMNKEPHHHLVLHNEYMNLYDVKVTVGDSIVLHRHDHDALAIAVGDQDLNVGIPGNPDIHQKTPDGQMRLQPSGYMHSTHVNGPVPYHTVAVEFLREQTNKRNLCAVIMAGQPTNCPETATSVSATKQLVQAQFASDQTQIETVRVLPHQTVSIGPPAGKTSAFQLIIALDPFERELITPAASDATTQPLKPGDFIWFDKAEPARTFKNSSDKEARIIEITFAPIPEVAMLPAVTNDRAWSTPRSRIALEKTHDSGTQGNF
jgi:hypothetical protein